VGGRRAEPTRGQCDADFRHTRVIPGASHAAVVRSTGNSFVSARSLASSSPKTGDALPIDVYSRGVGVVLFILASAVVAARLLLLYGRLRQPPELFLGLAYLLAGTLGWGGLLAGALTTPHNRSLAEGYQAWSVVVGDTGTLCFYLFVWYVFRRDSRLAKAFVALVVLVFVVSIIDNTVLRGVTFGAPPGTWTTIAGASARAIVFPWMAVEAFSSYFAFRRRAKFGLGNPLVANRLLLWGLSAVVMFAISATANVLYWTASDAVDATLQQNRAGGLYGLLAALSSIALWLAFFPPRAYETWIGSAPTKQANHG
jgi:hypothetical protein